ncbi:hypothetical protein GZZ44_10510 [Klebsiella aerogenes]|uniref:phage adaptor protein n=1 Tax=Klebsiella aerogenes TaxID=548 RepID=UPI00190EB99D|nr:hypothetical protein [Klebsiella aerogenes]MBK0633379.1 hypothetical protein [Klebsiella aerogenes]
MAKNYNQLVADVKKMSGRTDSETLNAIPSFIDAAQTKLDSILRIAPMISRQDFPADGLAVQLPYMEIDNVIIGSLEGVMFPLSDVLAKRRLSDSRAFTMYYAVNGNNIELVSPADVSITGYERPPRLASGNQTNAYTDEAYNALLWSTLGFLGVFIRDSEMAQSWMALAEEEVTNLNDAFSRYKSAGGLASESARYL